MAAATTQLQGQQNHPSLLAFPTKKKIKQLDCFVPAHLHLAEDRKKEACSLKCQQCFLPLAGGYRWGGESQLLAPRIKCGLQRNNGSAFLSVCPLLSHWHHWHHTIKMVFKRFSRVFGTFVPGIEGNECSSSELKCPAAMCILNIPLTPAEHACRVASVCWHSKKAPSSHQPWPQTLGCDLCTTASSCSFNQKAAKTGTANQQDCAFGNRSGTVWGKNFQAWQMFLPPTKTFIPELTNMVFNCCSPAVGYSDTDVLVQRKTSQLTMTATP